MLVCLVMTMALGAGMVALTGNDLNAANHIRNTTVAFNLAESGADQALRWLRSSPYPPLYTTQPFGAGLTLGLGSYNATITPDPGNSGALLKAYKITSVGTCNGVSEQVELFAREESFGRYAYFTDSEVSSVTGQPIWFYSGDRIRGPAHSNNANGTNFNIYWDPTSTTPIFDQIMTSASGQVNWSPSTPSTADYAKIFATGANGFQLNVDPISLPSSSDEQKVAAWGASTGFPTTAGVYTPTGGGIYIVGDATISLQAQKSGVQQFTIGAAGKTYTVTVDMNAGTTTTKVGTTTTTTKGGNSGVVYSTGNVTSLSGTVSDNTVGSGNVITARNAYTIATDTLAGNGITLSGNLTYKTAYDPTLAPADPKNLQPGTLGLFARNIVVAAGAPKKMEIDAVILAGNGAQPDGSFYVQDWDSKTPTGTLTVVGGVIQKNRGPVGTFSTAIGGSILTGYAKDYWYDERLADMPPPYFPTTGGYDRISWRRTPL